MPPNDPFSAAAEGFRTGFSTIGGLFLRRRGQDLAEERAKRQEGLARERLGVTIRGQNLAEERAKRQEELAKRQEELARGRLDIDRSRLGIRQEELEVSKQRAAAAQKKAAVENAQLFGTTIGELARMSPEERSLVGATRLAPFISDKKLRDQFLKKLDNPSPEFLSRLEQIQELAGSDPVVGALVSSPAFQRELRFNGAQAFDRLLKVIDQREKAQSAQAKTRLTNLQTQTQQFELEEARRTAPLERGKLQAETRKLRAQAAQKELETSQSRAVQPLIARMFQQEGTLASLPPEQRINTLNSMAAALATTDPETARALTNVARSIAGTPSGKAASETAVLGARRQFERNAPISGFDANFLGVPAGTTSGQLSKQGIRVPPPKVKQELITKKSAIESFSRTASNVVATAQSNPKAFGTPGSIATSLRNLKSNIQRTAELFGVDFTIPIPEAIRGAVDKAIKGTALDTDVARSNLQTMIYAAGEMVNQTGRSFTEKDAERVATQIAASASDPEALTTVLRTFVLLQAENFAGEFKAQTGANLKIVGGLPVDLKAPFDGLSAEELKNVPLRLLPDSLFEKLKQRILDIRAQTNAQQ